MKSRLLALLAVAAMVAGACTGTADPAPSLTTTLPPGTTIAPDTAPETSDPDTTEAPPPLTPFADQITVGEPIQLSSTHRVVNVPSDDVLNVRRVPGAGGPLVAEADPAYGLFRFTGETQVADDGGTWAKVVMADPAVQLVHDPEPFEVAWGWINAHYFEPVTEFGPIGGSCDTGSFEDHDGDDSSAADTIVDLMVLELEDCAQVVVTLGERDGVVRYGVTLPDVVVDSPSEHVFRVLVPSPADDWMQVLWPASEVFNEALEVYTVRAADGQGTWIMIHGAAEAGVSYLADQGQIVVTVRGHAALPDRNQSVVVTEVLAGDGSLALAGYARPFEATMSVRISNDADEVMDVPALGDSVYQPGAGAFGVMTTDWLEAWGWYSFTLDTSGLAAGEYVVTLSDDSAYEGADTPRVTVPFMVP